MLICAVCPLDNLNIPENSFVHTTGAVVTLRGVNSKVRKYLKGLGWVSRVALRGSLSNPVGVTLDFKYGRVLFDVNQDTSKTVVGSLAALLETYFPQTAINAAAYELNVVEEIVNKLSGFSYTQLLISANVLEGDSAKFIGWVNENAANIPVDPEWPVKSNTATIDELMAAIQKSVPKPKYKWVLNKAGVKIADGGNLAV